MGSQTRSSTSANTVRSAWNHGLTETVHIPCAKQQQNAAVSVAFGTIRIEVSENTWSCLASMPAARRATSTAQAIDASCCRGISLQLGRGRGRDRTCERA